MDGFLRARVDGELVWLDGEFRLDWRPGLVVGITIPLVLAITFVTMFYWGVGLHKISLGSLIIALGLLVDDPVVAGDAIKRELDRGHRSLVAAWLGPTKLATAILFATITNIVAYLPLLMLQSQIGASSVDDIEIRGTIRRDSHELDRLWCPHSATAAKVFRRLLARGARGW